MKERRHTLIANATFQMRWMLTAVISGFVVVNLVLILAYLTAGIHTIPPNVMLRVGIVVAAAEIIALIIITYFARQQSNRIAGPFLRVQQVAGALSQGDLTVVSKAREGDHFQQELEQLNSAIGALRSRIDAAKQTSESLSDANAPRIREQLAWFKTK